MTGGRSFFERALGDDGGVFLRIGVILLAAFIVAASIQRVLVGQYGGINMGSLEVAEIATASDEALKELKDAITQVQQARQRSLQNSRLRSRSSKRTSRGRRLTISSAQGNSKRHLH